MHLFIKSTPKKNCLCAPLILLPFTTLNVPSLQAPGLFIRSAKEPFQTTCKKLFLCYMCFFSLWTAVKLHMLQQQHLLLMRPSFSSKLEGMWAGPPDGTKNGKFWMGWLKKHPWCIPVCVFQELESYKRSAICLTNGSQDYAAVIAVYCLLTPSSLPLWKKTRSS